MTTLTVSAVTVTKASGTLTSNNTNVSVDDTVTIASLVYTFKAAPTTVAYQVKIGADADASLLNLIRAINGSGTPGTDYGSLTPENAQVSAATSVTAHAFAVTARSGIDAALATTTTAATLSWGAATLTGGSVAITATMSDATYTQPAQQMSIGDLPSGNTAWARTLMFRDTNVFCLRAGVSGVALASINKICYTVNRLLTWFTQPSATSVAATGAGTATFTVAGSSELTPSGYQWQYSANGLNAWTNATGAPGGLGMTFTNDTTATLTCDPTSTAMTGYSFRCLVTTPAGVTISDSAVLTITT